MNRRKSAQVSNAVAINNLIKLMAQAEANANQRDKETLFYFAAIADALAEAFPTQFVNPDGSTKDIYRDYFERKYKIAAPASPPQVVALNDEAFKLVLTGDTDANTNH